MQKMVDMKMPKRTEQDLVPSSIATEGPRYPWGLMISLDDDCLKKLAMAKLPEVGSQLTLDAVVKVTSVESRDSQGGKQTRSVSLQITQMSLDDGKDAGEDQAKTLFPAAAAPAKA